MYNRYVPQPDGSYHKNRVAEQSPHSQPVRNPPVDNPKPSATEPQHCNSTPPQPPQSAGNFLKNLLPKEFDTGDLLIVLLLLLMAGRENENKSDALVTLALYFFM